MKIKIYRYEALDSTNSEAIRQAEQGCPEGAVFVADQQTLGRGRQGSHWESPPGRNLYVTFLFRPSLPPADAVPITQLAAHAVLETLNPYAPGRFRIKWPNDLLLDDRKICGILSEMGSQAGQTLWVVGGIGINVNATEADFSPDIGRIATSLKIGLGREVDREEVLQRLVRSMDRWYEKFLQGEVVDEAVKSSHG